MNSWMLEFENNAKIETVGKKGGHSNQVLQSSYSLAWQTEAIQTKLSLAEREILHHQKEAMAALHMGTTTADRSDARNIPGERTDNSVGLVL